MNSHTTFHRLITGSLLATFAVAALAPAAQAGHGSGQYRKLRGFQPEFVARAGYTPRVVEYRRSYSNGGSTLAGFLGGLAVGAILTSAAQSHAHATVCEPEPVYYAPPQPAYYAPPAYCPPPRDAYYSYNDPYSHERFASLDVYLAHTRNHCGHPLIVQVIANREGGCVDVIEFDEGRWQSCDRETRDHFMNDWDD